MSVDVLRPAPTESHQRDAARRLVLASDERRRAVERILHDGVQQHMALLGLKLSMLQKLIDSDVGRAGAMCTEVRDEVKGALRDLRQVAHLIYPAILEHDGLAPALDQAAARLGVRVTVDVPSGLALPRGVDSAVYFCCLEALDNAAKHAGEGAAIAVSVQVVGDEVIFEVRDSGQGFDDDESSWSGLQHIADRVEALDGSLHVTSTSGEGTTVRASLPLHDPNA